MNVLLKAKEAIEMVCQKANLFSKKGYGLPIGNLTSQLFGNIYLNKLDHFIKEDMGIKYCGRYVDDILIVHRNRNILKK